MENSDREPKGLREHNGTGRPGAEGEGNVSNLAGAVVEQEGSTHVLAAAEGHGGLAHTTSVRLLVSVFAALIVLTGITVAVTTIDLGPTWNLVVAMGIATLKAGLVVVFFMHLLWDKKFNLLVFLTGVLFVVLFLSLTLNDRSEYQERIDALEEDAASMQ